MNAGPNKILDLETGAVRAELGVHPWGEVRALSQDGRWAASCGWHSDGVRLWDVGTGQVVHEWVVGKQQGPGIGATNVFFTPDSRALIICQGDDFSFWDVGTLQLIRRLPRDIALSSGHVAFSRDGRLMALEMAPGVIHLKEVAGGRTVATFEDPHGDRASWQGFTPDGTQLVVVSNHATAVHVWDLRAIRKRLKEMGLDWDWPELSPAPAEDPGAEPVTIKVDLGEPAKPAPVLTREERVRQSIERFRQQVEATPDSALACHNLAWTYLTAPEALRDAKAALPLAEKAARLAPGELVYRNTLGVAYYRAGRYREAVDALSPNVERQGDRNLAIVLYFLAMSHHRLGEPALARNCRDFAFRWAQLQRGLGYVEPEELTAGRAEAEELLGIARKKN
jgi:hypothetical protein